MSRRIVSSEGSAADSAPSHPTTGRVARSSDTEGRGGRGAGAMQDGTRRGRSVRSHDDASERGFSRSRADGEFLDARKLSSEDLIEKTLKETTGTLGITERPKVVDFSARLKEKRAARTRTTAIRVAIVAAAVLVVGALTWLLLFSPVFRLESSHISVSGANQWVSSSQILSIAEKQSGKSLFLVSGGDVTEQLENIPGVTQARAGKHFPNRLEISIQAQRPAAMLKTKNQPLTAVDGQGRILNSVSGVSTDGIPVIEVSDVNTGLRSRAIKEALKVLSSLPESMRKSITQVSAQTQDSITTELNGGNRVIVWGDASQMELKKAIVDKIINDPTKIGDKHQVDVSAPLRPIIK